VAKEEENCVRDIAAEFVEAWTWYTTAPTDEERADAKKVLEALQTAFPLDVMRTVKALRGEMVDRA
jgi:hypothetical protein